METINRREALRRVGVLMGGVLCAPTVAGVLGGCGVDTTSTWSPVVLNSDQAGLLEAMVEQILPTTETPGAIAAQVPAFIDRMLDEWYPDRLRLRFTDGLDAFAQQTVAATGSSFQDLAEDQKRRMLSEQDTAEFTSASPGMASGSADDVGANAYDDVEATTPLGRSPLSDDAKGRIRQVFSTAAGRVAARRPDGGPVVRADTRHEGDLSGDPSFFRMLKELTLVGYYTSETGATEELRFVQVPGRWEACVPFDDVGRSWAI